MTSTAAGRQPLIAWEWLLVPAITLLALVALRLGLPLFHGVVLCPFRAWTGLPCVACGGTRALASLATGAPWQAFLWNPLAALAALGCLLLPPIGLLPAGRRILAAMQRRLWRRRVLLLLLGAQWIGLLARALIATPRP